MKTDIKKWIKEFINNEEFYAEVGDDLYEKFLNKLEFCRETPIDDNELAQYKEYKDYIEDLVDQNLMNTDIKFCKDLYDDIVEFVESKIQNAEYFVYHQDCLSNTIEHALGYLSNTYCD